MKIFKINRTGNLHIENGVENQDKIIFRQIDKTKYISAVFDGCSSAKYSFEFVNSVSDSLLHYFTESEKEEILLLLENIDEQFAESIWDYSKSKILSTLLLVENELIFKKLIRDIAFLTRDKLVERFNTNKYQLACTMILSIIDVETNTLLIFHIGDGFVLGKKQKEIEFLSLPSNIDSDEQRTYFLSDDDLLLNCQLKYCELPDEVFMSTDGIQKVFSLDEIKRKVNRISKTNISNDIKFYQYILSEAEKNNRNNLYDDIGIIYINLCDSSYTDIKANKEKHDISYKSIRKLLNKNPGFRDTIITKCLLIFSMVVSCLTIAIKL